VAAFAWVIGAGSGRDRSPTTTRSCVTWPDRLVVEAFVGDLHILNLGVLDHQKPPALSKPRRRTNGGMRSRPCDRVYGVGLALLLVETALRWRRSTVSRDRSTPVCRPMRALGFCCAWLHDRVVRLAARCAGRRRAYAHQGSGGAAGSDPVSGRLLVSFQPSAPSQVQLLSDRGHRP
jgi:hypothetical protein